jgi:prephenate dehydrogenase
VKVAVAGLGLIGGSFAKAYKNGGHTVYAMDSDRTILGFARLSGAVDDELSEENIRECDLIIIALYPKDAVEFLEKNAAFVSPQAIVIDCCGTKREVCAACFAIAEKSGFTFVGGHPMAGKQYSGFKYSSASMFNKASMILVPPRFDDMALIDRVKKRLEPCGFGRITVTSAEKHDEMIAFTSQLAHIVSNAYIKSPTARAHKGFSAGSYKDLTRVAYLNETMWSELFLENRENVINELDHLIQSLTKYRDALHEGDGETLKELLREGKVRKGEVDRVWKR